MSSSHTALKYIRLAHLYLGVFTAPALIFFAFTGALQTFSLHETTRGSSYKPPAWAVMLGQIHKKQTPIVAVKKTSPPDKRSNKAASVAPDKAIAETPQASSPSQPEPVELSQSAQSQSEPSQPAQSQPTPAAPPKSHNPLPLKCFFLLVSIALFASTLSGLYMTYKYVRNRPRITALLLAGIIIPILLTIF